MAELTLECPANYFGKGEDYLLPDDAETVREFERRFAEWEQAHPDDPTGDLALAKWKAEHASTPTAPRVGLAERVAPPLREATEEKVPEIQEGDELRELELVMPERYIRRLKEFCRYKRRRPRDMVMLWIETYCKL